MNVLNKSHDSSIDRGNHKAKTYKLIQGKKNRNSQGYQI